MSGMADTETGGNRVGGETVTFQRGTQWGLDSTPDSWRHDAACLTTDAELFFVDSGASHRDAVRAAKRICAGCPVRDRCLRDALTAEWGRPANNRFGIWGGLVPAERHQVERCQSGRCAHAEHAPADDYGRLVVRIAELAGRGMSDTEIGERVRRSPNRVQALRKEHGIRAGWWQRGAK